MALITCQNVTLGYDGHAVAENLTFSVNNGDYMCIVGENGSGKSTLMKTLLHLQEPLDGKIEIGGGFGQKEIGYLPQQIEAQKDFPATVWEIVLSGCQSGCGIRPFYNKSEKERAKKNIERMGINDLTKRCYRELSGGQQQRALLARALCATKRLLILDEPVSGLDPKVTADMYSLIKELNTDGITVIMISHDISAAVKYATHILHLGKNQFFGTKEDYIKSGTGKYFLNETGGEQNA